MRHAASRIAAAALLVASIHSASGQNAVADFRDGVLLSRIAQVLQDERSLTLISVLDENLDLATRLQRESGVIPALVPLAPPLVVGQGDDAANQTLVRVLNGYGIAESSFLAFAPDVRGGVWVAAGRDGRGRNVIAAAPIAAPKVREIRLFNRLGGHLGSIKVNAKIAAPLVIACGDFLPQLRGDELAIMAKNQTARDATLLIYDLSGQLHKTLSFGALGADTISLSALPNASGARLALYFQQHKTLLEVATQNGQTTRRALPFLAAGSAIYPTAFADNAAQVLASGPEPLLSTVTSIDARAHQKIDVGQHENEFWVSTPQDKESRYVKAASPYMHVRVDEASPAFGDPQIALRGAAADEKKQLDSGRHHGVWQKITGEFPRRLWEPTFTHRMHYEPFQKWAALQDADGLPQYLSLTRHNKPVTYGEFGKTAQFSVSTYAPGLPALDRLYLLPLRGFLDTLAQHQRANPERFIAVEPNHEHEIAIRDDATIGDYNPAMIAGFGKYLQRLSGRDEAGVKAHYALPPGQKFDAPRNDNRGVWDAYSEQNPFFMEWTSFNRYVVNRRLADGFTQALLAGLPPELIKSHQIPDIFAIASTKGFSNVRNRITPIDYAMSAGVGLGYTRYGVWFQKPAQMQKAARTSGFDSVILGEYQALTPDQNAATGQLNYLFDNGATAITAMKWPARLDKNFNATMAQAIRDLIARDAPRPGVTGGVGQVVPFGAGQRTFNIAAIGSGSANTGQLKSLRADGSWEGSVYAVPFRTAVKIETVPARWHALPNGARRLVVGPLRALEGGQQIEITLQVLADAPRTLNFAVRAGDANGPALPGLSYAIALQKGARNVRLITRSQLPADHLFITLDVPRGVQSGDVLALRENEQIARLHRGVMEGARHRGGVTFDILK